MRKTAFFASALLLGAPLALAQRTQLKPAWNLFSPQDDIKLGKEVAADAKQQLPSCNAPKVDAYLTDLGKKLIMKLPTGGVQYPFEFHCVNDKEINAFALPGGFVFVNRGLIEASNNESQLAGVIAHELSHVALRHGTSEATKAKAAQLGVDVIDTLLGGNAGGALITELGRFSAGGVLLRYSRASETQADILGTQVLYDSGYDPRALAQFFEKMDAESQENSPPEFFSDHPSPERRVERVEQEIVKLGGEPKKVKRDSLEFEAIKKEVAALPVLKKETLTASGGSARPAGPPPGPSAKYAEYQASAYTVKYPDNWKKYGEKDDVSFAPDGGVMEIEGGHAGLAYGIVVSVTKVPGDATADKALDTATQRFIMDMQKDNPKMKVERQPGGVRVNGQPGLSTYLSNESPAGGEETDWLITVIRPEGLVSFVCAAPARDYENYDKAFAAFLDSVKFTR